MMSMTMSVMVRLLVPNTSDDDNNDDGSHDDSHHYAPPASLASRHDNNYVLRIICVSGQVLKCVKQIRATMITMMSTVMMSVMMGQQVHLIIKVAMIKMMLAAPAGKSAIYAASPKYISKQKIRAGQATGTINLVC